MEAWVALWVLATALPGTPQEIASIGSNQDEAVVMVSGVLRGQVDEAFKLFQLCPDEKAESLGDCLDLLVPDELAAEYVKLDNRRVIAKCTFVAFGDSRVGMGNLSSRIGMIKIDSITPSD